MVKLRGSRRLARYATGFAWTGFDQVLSTVSNLVIALAVARGGGARALGIYTVAFAVYLVVFAVQRALVNEPLLTLPAMGSKPPDESDRLSAGSALGYLLPVSLVVLGFGLLLARPELIVLAVALPFVCMQDLYRYIFFRRERPESAVVLDGVWVLSSVIGWPLIISSGSPAVAVGVWAIGGSLGMLIGTVTSRVTPARISESLRWWWKELRPLGGFLAIETIVFIVFTQLRIIGLAAILGVSELGTLRGAQIVLGPAGLALVAFNVFALPRLSSRRNSTNTNDAWVISAGAALMVWVSSIVLWIAAPVLLPFLYGGALAVPRILVLAIGTRLTVTALSTGPVLMLKANQRGKPIAVARITAGLIGLPIVLGTAAAVGLVAAVWAGTISAAIHLIIVTIAWVRTVPAGDASPTAM